MLTHERIDTSPSGSTFMTSTAGGTPQVVDVDEWLYRATRVRGFVSRAEVYAPRHRAEGEVAS
jgi:hypothetical protein